jgi:hypothetical protein
MRPAVALAGPLHPVTVPGPAVSAAVALPVRERRDAGTPKRRRRMWRNRSSCTWAFAMGTDWTTTPEFGHEDERTWAVKSLPHPPQRAGMQDEVGRQGPVNRSCLGYDARLRLGCPRCGFPGRIRLVYSRARARVGPS